MINARFLLMYYLNLYQFLYQTMNGFSEQDIKYLVKKYCTEINQNNNNNNREETCENIQFMTEACLYQIRKLYKIAISIELFIYLGFMLGFGLLFLTQVDVQQFRRLNYALDKLINKEFEEIFANTSNNNITASSLNSTLKIFKTLLTNKVVFLKFYFIN